MDYKDHSIVRKGYYRKPYVRKDGTKVRGVYVKPSRILDRGKIGKGPQLITIKKHGIFSNLGYHVKDPQYVRRPALLRVLKKYGYAPTIRRLNALRVLLKNTSPAISARYIADMNWLKSHR